MDHCQNEPNRKVMQVRDCNNPVPRFGGALCPNPLDHEREITCHEANYTSIETIFYIATAYSETFPSKLNYEYNLFYQCKKTTIVEWFLVNLKVIPSGIWKLQSHLKSVKEG